MPTLIYKSKSRTVKIHWTLDEGDDKHKQFAVHLSSLLEAIGIESLSYLLAQALSFTMPDEELCGGDDAEAKKAETSLFEAAEAFVFASDDLYRKSIENTNKPT